jgi:hypothetical protein
MRLVGHVAHIGDMRNVHKMSENLKGRDHSTDKCAEGRIILKRS